jgi:hypothetical protein
MEEQNFKTKFSGENNENHKKEKKISFKCLDKNKENPK